MYANMDVESSGASAVPLLVPRRSRMIVGAAAGLFILVFAAAVGLATFGLMPTSTASMAPTSTASMAPTSTTSTVPLVNSTELLPPCCMDAYHTIRKRCPYDYYMCNLTIRCCRPCRDDEYPGYSCEKCTPGLVCTTTTTSTTTTRTTSTTTCPLVVWRPTGIAPGKDRYRMELYVLDVKTGWYMSATGDGYHFGLKAWPCWSTTFTSTATEA
jgi:hypothetical protein